MYTRATYKTTTTEVTVEKKSLLDECVEKEPQPKVLYTPVKIICTAPFCKLVGSVCRPKVVSCGVEE